MGGKHKVNHREAAISVSTIILAAFMLYPIWNLPAASAAHWYVDASVPESGDGMTSETAFKNVQEGINAACEGDIVIASEGTYYEKIKFNGKNIVVRSTDPLDPDVVANTIIDGSPKGSVVTFSGTEDETCVLSGFTIQNGDADLGAGIFGGTSKNPNHALIENNTITQNYGGGLAYCNGTIHNNRICQNRTSGFGGGLLRCDGMILKNVIAENSAEYGGGGLRGCDGVIRNNTIIGNSAGHSRGGGLAFCKGTIRDNVIAGNSANSGGGLAFCQARIEGNTISDNSAARDGGGLYRCDRTICSNVIRGNQAGYGGGLAHCDGTISNNVISDNSGSSYGGGLYDCDGTIHKNTITGNRDSRGGGLSECDGLIQNNVISGNSGGKYGGGLAHCDGTIQNNIITDNSTANSGGGLYDCNGSVQNNIISHNSGGYGGGLYDCSGTVQNNTISQNSARSSGGGLYDCAAAIRNCIIWGNCSAHGAQLQLSSQPTYSCIQDSSGGGEGNIAEDPRFVAPAHWDDNNTLDNWSDDVWIDGDYRLQTDSPCIDAGHNSAPDLPDSDIAGMHRILYGGRSLTVDMGAYEYYINQLQPGPRPDETTLTWSSLAGETYLTFYSHDLLTWHLACTIPSAGNTTTSWTDDGSKTGMLPSLAARRFYRILENP